jgi:hypothetical protein
LIINGNGARLIMNEPVHDAPPTELPTGDEPEAPTAVPSSETALERTGPMRAIGTPTLDGNGIHLGYGPVPADVRDAIRNAAEMTRHLVGQLPPPFAPASIGFEATPVADALESDETDHPFLDVVEEFGHNLGRVLTLVWDVEHGERPADDLLTAAKLLQREYDRLARLGGSDAD